MRKLLKGIGIFLLVLIGAVIGVYLFVNEPMPTGMNITAADALAHRMETALNKPAWDTTRLVRWSFKGGHDYIWDKAANWVEVRWSDKRVLLHTVDQTGKAWQNDRPLNGAKADKALTTAWAYFCNDSFWLAAPFKTFDPGTTRSLVMTEAADALLVQYSSGGVTPGDAYLYRFDNDGKPLSWQLWVTMLPVGGLTFSWEDYITTPQGAILATEHAGPIQVSLTNVSTADDFSDWGMADPFASVR